MEFGLLVRPDATSGVSTRGTPDRRSDFDGPTVATEGGRASTASAQHEGSDQPHLAGDRLKHDGSTDAHQEIGDE